MTRKSVTLKRRTTLTLPADSLLQAQKIADSRRVNLSTVIAEVVAAGLQFESAKQRSDQILDNYRKAFAGFSEDELAIMRRSNTRGRSRPQAATNAGPNAGPNAGNDRPGSGPISVRYERRELAGA